LLLMLAGCVSIEPVYLANGMKVVRIGCGLAADGASACYQTAGHVCGRRGFALYDWDGRPWPLPYPDPASIENHGIPGATLLVACRS
jgi:hypothetical protein